MGNGYCRIGYVMLLYYEYNDDCKILSIEFSLMDLAL